MADTSEAPQKPQSFLRRWAKRLLFCVYLVVVVSVLLEVALRIWIPFNPSYYTGFGEPEPNSVVTYPYGEIRFNADGYPDDPFEETKSKPRIAYVGDSVTYGVGAGHGYRITELLEVMLPAYEHMNFGRVAALGLGPESEDHIINKVVTKYQIDRLVYVMNLNDVLPDVEDEDEQEDKIDLGWRRKLDWLRGKSYLYTYVRNIAKTYYTRKGYGASGLVTFEMFPEKYADVIQATVARVNAFYAKLKPTQAEFVVLILPYEMQISEEAAARYEKLGIHWGDSFLEGRTQAMLTSAFDDGIIVLDAYQAFVNDKRSRKQNGLGEFFVYDRGDKIDWNHPNRAGHKLVAEFLASQQVFAAPPRGGPR